MRKFTKDHNDLKWLFPLASTDSSAEKIFDDAEKMAEYLLDLCYSNGQEIFPERYSFTKDNMIDAYMKGHSQGMQITVCDMLHYKSLFYDLKYENSILEKRHEADLKEIERLTNELNRLQDK